MAEKKPENLKISVEEDIKIKDVPPGTFDSLAKNEEKLPKEEVAKRQKIMLEYTRLLSRYVEPHNKKSRWVTEKDLPRLLNDGKDLVALCNIPRGDYAGIAALSHSQIDDKDPLRFFVLQKGLVIINPVIFNHTKTTISKNEGCMSFPYHAVKTGVKRYNKITLVYQTLENKENGDPIISKPITEGANANTAHIYQHEISHCNGVNIYDKDYSADSVEGLGKGSISEEEALKLYK